MILDIMSEQIQVLIDIGAAHYVLIYFSGKLSSKAITIIGVKELLVEILYSSDVPH